MRMVLVTPPAAEPVTLDELKLYLRLDGSDEDSLVAGLGRAARERVEAETGARLIHQLWRLTLDGWPAGGVATVPFGPVRGVVALRARNANGSTRELPVSLARPLEGADPPRVVFEAPPAGLAPGPVELDLLIGFAATGADAPAAFLEALRRLVAAAFENRGDADTPSPRAALAALAPFRSLRLA